MDPLGLCPMQAPSSGRLPLVVAAAACTPFFHQHQEIGMVLCPPLGMEDGEWSWIQITQPVHHPQGHMHYIPLRFLLQHVGGAGSKEPFQSAMSRTG